MAIDIFISTKNEESIFTTCFATQLPLLIKGPTGCGKSQLVEYMAKKLNRPLIKVSCNEDTNAADLLGRYLLKSGETVWQDGPVTQALRTSSILYLDELAEAREDVIVALHPLTDHRREVHIDKINETVKATNDFMVVASYNPGYQKGIKELKPSTKQRFVCLSMDYLNVHDETRLIAEVAQISLKTAEQLALLGQKIRTKEGLMLKETVSSRLLINAASLIKNNLSTRLACHLAIAEVLSDDREIVNALKDYINLYI
ncbi:CbbQ/NirQ/NorQ/GpvN family protein [Pseudobdellovibrio sp. HCB154]|uniref:CbbQ/NirQ/NorQ/GpvN family protein n=1 Tax=Pseudobdellovibrio sp. HCB154 TaxID=3386277 RepID=UPI003916EBDA